MRTRPKSFVAAILAASLLLCGSAQASPDTLRNAFTDITGGLFDIVLSPVTAAKATAGNWEPVGDDTGSRAIYAIPGYAGLTLLHMASGGLRALTGSLYTLPGLLLFPFSQTDLPREANPFATGEALVEAANPLGQNPSWVKYIVPITPLTMDAKLGVISPWADYDVPPEEFPSKSSP